MKSQLQKKINNKSAKVAVIGLGYVGLPLAVNFAKAGYTTFGVDKDVDRVKRLLNKENYILDVAGKDVFSVISRKKFLPGTDFSVLNQADAIIICVPTPLKSKYTPDPSFIVSAVKAIRENIKKGVLVVLESTTYPGTTEELIRPEFEKAGLRIDRDYFLAFSPERIDPGNKCYDVTKITKIIGGMTPKSGALTQSLYEKIISKTHMVSSAKAAEMTKLLENSFRLINIGWANEVAMMCRKMKIDVWEVIDAAKTKPFGFMPFYPGLGVGGHCIPDDPLYLYWKARHHGFSSKFIKLSADINSGMPQYAVGVLADLLKKQKKKLSGAKILVMGVTYKKDVKDLRRSPPLVLIELLEAKKAAVDYHDPVIPYLEIGKIRKKKSVPLTAKNVKAYDCVIITTDHTDVNYSLLLKNAGMIFDVRNVYKTNHANVVKL